MIIEQRFHDSRPSQYWPACDFTSDELPDGTYRLTCRHCGEVRLQRKPNRVRPCSARPLAGPPSRSRRRRWWPRPGHTLAAAIHRAGHHYESCESCRKRQQQMNDWGWLGCWRERRTIAGWIQEQATARKIPFRWRTALGLLIVHRLATPARTTRRRRRTGSRRHAAYLASRKS